ncbi:MAG: DUF4838 domain-containing protein [Victivallales bacterium]|nr:DUF4838 domain-containing protein [Victivallales bacterium]
MSMKHCICMLAAFFVSIHALSLELVTNGQSKFTIYYDQEKATDSVRWAAQELQKYCERVTGAKLPIVSTPTSPMICLGINDAAKAAGASLDGIVPEGYEMRAANGNLFIYGEDTPNGKVCKGGGVCHGTRNGVCTLLEEAFGVRWLMPGPYGDYWPSKTTITVTDGVRRDEPGFLNRRIPYIQPQFPIVKDWEAHQKLGYSLYLEHSHNWFQVCPPSAYEKHPEWFAKSNGKTVRPAGQLYMLCMTNRSTIERYAQAAEDYFKSHPNSTCFSLSPNDGNNWCDCPECSKYYEKDPYGKFSSTPAVLRFYNEVAKIFHPKHPDKILAGYVYADYIYPPSTPFKLEDGLFLVWAVSFDYGYTLFRKDIQEKFDKLLPQWPKMTSNLAFYDLPTYTKNTLGIPCTPGLEIMKFLFPRIKNNSMKGVYYYGNRAWGHAALHNYLIAKLEWNPYADVDALFTEFCDKAYGPASPEMQAIYHLYDAAVKDWYVNHPEEDFRISTGRMKKAYVETLPEVARLFEQGIAKVTDKRILERLNYFKINLMQMEYNFKFLALLPDDFKSCFTASEQEVNDILANPAYQFAICTKYEGSSNETSPQAAGFKTAEPFSQTAAGAKPILVRGRQEIVFIPKTDGDVIITCKPKRSYGSPHVLSFFDENNKPISKTLLRIGKPMTFKAKAGKLYKIVYSISDDFFTLQLDNAYWGYQTTAQPEGIHLQNEPSTLFFYVSKDVKSFRATLRGGDSVRETCVGKMTTPSGRIIPFQCETQSIDEQVITPAANEVGLWKIEITKAAKLYFDDHFFKLSDGIPEIIFQDPQNMLLAK